MSCNLNKHAVIPNIRSIKSFLKFSDETQTPDDYSAEAWNSAWGEEGAEESKCEVRLKGGEQSWLQECLASLSPSGDVMALAHGSQAAFLTAKWASEGELKFAPSFEGRLAENENISSILCLPLASQKRSLHGGPDWTCIVVGFSSGYIRIYTESADLLVCQRFHEEPVGHLKCKSHLPRHFPNTSDQPDELVIVFSTVVVVIDGFGLFQTLRACRNQLARASAGRQEVVHPPPLSYKKWGFHEHDKLMDCEAAGAMNTSTFDHLASESVRKGFYGAVRPTVPAASLLITTGCNPYVGYYHATEGSGQLLLTDVVQAVASKLMNLISSYNASGLVGGLMGFGQQPPKDQKAPKIEPATILPLRFGLYDRRRQGARTSLSPDKRLAAVSDAFGRVVLFDVNKGVAVRMWKGYRDAQCGWVEVEEGGKEKDPRRAFFLVIYAPRRGILEVWCSQQGPRVAAFNVGKAGRLLCPGCAMVGGAPSRDHVSACFFLDGEGLLRRVGVPFHLTLSEKNSKRARDMHLLRELKGTLKNTTKGRSFEMIKILRDMRTSCARIQALESIVGSRHSTVELVEEVTTALLTHLNKLDPLQTDHDTKVLQQCCVRTLQLAKLYKTVNGINARSIETDSPPQSVDIQMYSTSLCISETEVGRILSLVTLHQTVVPVLKRQVRFNDDSATEMSFVEFAGCFVVNDNHLFKAGEDLALKDVPVDLVADISGKQVEALGGFLFDWCVRGGSCFSTLQVALRESCIRPHTLLNLLLKHWVSDAGFCAGADKWVNLQQVMKHISSLSDPKLVSCDSEHVSPWWASVREALHKATGNVAAFIGAVVARSVSVIMAAAFSVEHKNIGKKKGVGAGSSGESEEECSDWESVSLDLEYWNVLVGQLEDVLMLNVLLRSSPNGETAKRDGGISVESVLAGGHGSVTDLVAVWAVSVGLEPDLLSSFLSEETEEGSTPQNFFLDDTSDARSINIVKGLLCEVRRRFPQSLSRDTLLANCGWEHLLQWSKDRDAVAHLTQALACISQVTGFKVKNGFCAMMWKTYILKTFEAAAHLMEKVGKTPKERLCRKELEMTDGHLENFLDFCCQLLNVILETNIPSESSSDSASRRPEPFWQQGGGSRTPLLDMALGQKAPSNRQVYWHLVLGTVMHLVTAFQLKSSRPLSLFTATVRSAFFRDLSSPIPESSSDKDVPSGLRLQFLTRAASAVAQGITEQEGASGEWSEAGMWFGRVLEVGRAWECDLDEVRRHYVCELYSGGQDALAQQVKACVGDQPRLSSQLLLLAGQRAHKVIFDSPDPAARLGCTTPDVSSFIRKLGDVPLRSSSVPLQSTLVLLEEILVHLEGGEARMGTSLRDALGDMASSS